MIFESHDIQISITIWQLKMIDNTEDRYIIFESEENQLSNQSWADDDYWSILIDWYMIFESQDLQFSRNLWQMMIIDHHPYIDMIFESQDIQLFINHM